ncbi:MAG: T9SS type A sorting domain-containing protein [Saprospiraceae bacterium]|nr:T9SS type A sorting domain-containing protein [Saprospiraceae bacterium]MCF8251138.1 T9SS type A sorting domain-containing protein [Saprospiraceae bacterium]MCF8282950.1 T9SS type A sorting domain-containing protein [Bacteroidales bacterium]MCF8312904.1 T9SS type A sorting domain-containing protein [Saprospiraceae bacterium]MCF8441397.1 T9SS type A sorting domain-containing protein [Saprospiraceae bacterium]
MKKYFFPLLLLFASQVVQAQPKAYLLGHSLVNFDMPAMIEGLSVASGKAYDYDLQVGIGANLGWQWTNPNTAQGDIWDTTLPNGGYTHFIFTEAVPLVNHLTWSDTYGFANKFYNYAALHNSGIRTYIYETWHCVNSGTPAGCDFDDHDDVPWRTRLMQDLPLWESIADSLLALHPGENIFLAPAGQALAMLFDSIAVGNAAGAADIHDFFFDDIHLNDKGNYLVACVMFAVIHGESPEGLPHQLYDSFGGPFDAPSPALAAMLQRIAWRTVCQYPRDGVACGVAANGEREVLPISIFPNPASDFLTVENSAGGSLQLRLYDGLGRAVRSFQVEGERAVLSLNGLPTGWYFLNPGGVVGLKFWKR